MSRSSRLAGALLLVMALAACSGTAASPAGPTATPDPNAIRVTANQLKFSTDRIDATADAPFSIRLQILESAPHNIAIYRDAAFGDKVFGEDFANGPTTVEYHVPALSAGTYYFKCDVHPDMKGQVVVAKP